jgi:hypothetical protein
MTTPKDGSQPRLNVRLLTATGRHTALDAISASLTPILAWT